jgi:type IV pilus assembly protein PilY1
MNWNMKSDVRAYQCLLMVLGLQSLNVNAVIPEVKLATSPLLTCVTKPTSSSSSLLNEASNVTTASAMSATILTTDGAYIYLSGFNPVRWSGSLKKHVLSLDASGLPKIANSAVWDASDILTGTNLQSADPLPDLRKIYTSRSQAGKLLATIEFKWGDLAPDQKSMLNVSPVTGKNDGLGENRLNYLRGAHSQEQGKSSGVFRTRDRILGDIVNSNSVYVGSPVANMQGADYHKFYNTYKDRTKAVYVGSNDGMLHAFDADNGHELFSYIPHSLFPALGQLSHPNYVHRPYVDGALSVSEAIIDGRWKTILVSGMGGGAQGLFALDVTNPSDFANGAGMLWEFTDNDDADMGNLMAAPIIAKFKIGTTKGVPDYRYFVVVSSGLNNYKVDGTGKYDASGSGALFLLSLDKAPSAKWEKNVNYFKFKTPVSTSYIANGLSAPALVIGNNGAVRYVYAGDLQGNLWRFDFNGNAPWTHARSSDEPIFTAKDAYGAPQPITTQPKIIFAPGGGYVILFGTGKYLEEADALPSTFKMQSFYGIHDLPQNTSHVTTRSQLALRTLVNRDDGGLKIIGNDFSYGVDSGSKQGWYFDFIDFDKTGERSVTNPVVAYGRLFFNTLVPDEKHCDKGAGRSYSLDALTGLSAPDDATGYVSEVGLLTSPVIFQIATKQSDRSPTVNAKQKKQYIILNFGTGGAKGAVAQSKTDSGGVQSVESPAKRLGWREVLNWQELRDAANKK